MNRKNQSPRRRTSLQVSLMASLAAGLMLVAAGCGGGDGGESAAANDPNAMTVAVIPKGTTHAYWQGVKAGAEKAGKELGVNIAFKGPLKENDRAQQIQMVEQFVADGTKAIVLAPLDGTALVRPVQDATKAGSKVVIIDSPLDAVAGTDYVSLVSTDNKEGGRLGGEKLAELLGKKGKVVLLRYDVGSTSTEAREAGFMEAIAKYPDIQVIVDNRYAGVTASEAQTAAMQMVDQLREADGIFTPNESTTFGMLLALRQNGLAGQKKFVGFDASEPLTDALKKDEINALVVQNPRKMGYEGVKAAVAAAKGESVPESMDTGVAVVTKANLDTPDIKMLLGTE